MFKKIILITIILCALEFFRLAFLPDIVIKAIEMVGVAIILFFLVIYFVYGDSRLGKMRFALPIALILISVLISMFGSYSFQNQSFAATAIGQRVIYFYLIYFLLHYLRIPIDFIKKTIVVFAIAYIVLYLAQYTLYPTELTKSKMFMDRGTLRIFMPGAGYLVIAYFIWLYLIFKSFRIRYLVFLLVSLAVFVLLGTRQVIASIVLLSILFLLQSKVVKSKLLFFSLIGLTIIPVYFLFEDILFAMFEVTVSQSQSIESNIRFRAAKFFLTDFFPNKIAYFTGNGAIGSSLYGVRIANYAERYGFYQADLGLIGEYTKYGVLFVVGVIIIFYRSLSPKLSENLMFIKYNFLGLILTLVTGGGAFGSSSTNILINCMLLYLIDLYLNRDMDSGPPLTVSSVTGKLAPS
ncbi:MAG: hypothetical protein KAR19_12425 [Bacteroidales bacterium]|nr:hypothetical protein [Bacteroidales bacterium]